jgi:lipopolysaccharide export system protein LptA
VVSAFLFVRRIDPGNESGIERNPLRELADVISAGEGFEYEVTEGERKLFHIRAERMETSRESLFELEKAMIEVEREDGRLYEVTADRATFQDQGKERETTLQGNAVVKSSTGVEVASDGFEVRRKGRLVVSTGPVSYRLGGQMAGTATELEAYLKQDRYQLSGEVRMVGGPEDPDFSLSCGRLIYDERNRRIHAEGAVVLERGSSQLRAERLSVTLAEESDDIRFVRARWDVSGVEDLGDEMESRMRFAAQDLSLVYDETTGRLRQAEFSAGGGEPVVIGVWDATQQARRMTAPRVVADFVEERPANIEAFGGVEITEYFLFSPNTILLRSCSQRAKAEFSVDGEIASLTLDDRVDLHQTDIHTVGDSVVRREDGSTEVSGSPAVVHSNRGRLAAPTIVHYDEGNRVEASGGVRADLARDSGFSMIREQGTDGEPIRVTSERASWEGEIDQFAFSGSVRAWQDEDFVIANELVGEQGGDVLRGRGGVRTVIESRRSEDEEATAEERAPVEVNAGEFSYRRIERLLRYTGSPVARQAGRMLRCEDLELSLDEESEVEQIVCQRNVVIEDPAEKRSIRGDLAVYTPGESLLEVSGAPAVMRDPEGSEVRGSVVVYDLESGVANVRSGAVPPLPDGAANQ